MDESNLDVIDMLASEEDAEAMETIQIIEVDDVAHLTIETDNAFAALGEPNEELNHALLNNRDIEDQHPISAITGLRGELDDIKRLQTIFSDKYNHANYYKWQDGMIPEVSDGLFVSCPAADRIQVCNTTDDIFGVTVTEAAFIGGQNEIARDDTYGLVVCSGVVSVRCELDVRAGDAIVSDNYGYAKKAESGYGYKVIGVYSVNDVVYAVIPLGISVNQVNDLMAEFDALEIRMGNAEKSIVATINVAQQAYNKASESSGVSEEALKNALDALLKAEDAVEKGKELEELLTSTNTTATQAKEIANATVADVKEICDNTEELANEALAEASELRKDFEQRVAEVDAGLNNTALELEATKEDILEIREELQQSIEDIKADVNATNDGIKKDIADTKASLKETQEDVVLLQEDIEPLTSWPVGSDSPTGIAGFVAQADENSVTLGGLVEWQGKTDKSIAAFKQEVADNYATQDMLSEVGDNLALFKQEVSNTYATQEMVSAVDDNLSKYKQEVTDTYATQEMVSSVDDALTSYKQEVSKNYVTQQMLSSVEDNITSFKQEVSDTYATQEMVTAVDDNLASFKQEVKDDYATQEMVTNVDNTLTSYRQEVEKNYATQQMLSSVENNLTSYKQEVADKYATQQMVTAVSDNLTSYKQEVTETYATQEVVSKVDESLTSFKQEVKDDYATQEMVSKVDDALTSYKQEATKTYATNISLASLKTETTDAIAASEEKATNTYALKSDLTSFEDDTNVAIARIEQKADDSGASIQNVVSSIDKYSVGEYSQSYGLSREQAESILKNGMIYVPTKHSDGDSHSEIFVGESEEQCFTPGSYYEWNINDQDVYDWIEYKDSVAFGMIEPIHTAQLQYWYVDSDTAPEGYEPHSLYIWKDEKWTKVNILAGNANNRVTSMIRQTADAISAEVVNARGSYSGLDMRLDNTDSQLQLATFWNNPESGKNNLATVRLNADDESSSLALVVMGQNGEETQLEGASIVLGQGDEKSYIRIEADDIDLSGYVTFTDLSTEGKTTISGSNITTGVIKSSNYSVNGDGSIDAGTVLDLDNGTWDSPNFKIDIAGNVDITGTVYATSGEIGGCSISDGTLWVSEANIDGKLSADVIDVDSLNAKGIAVKSDIPGEDDIITIANGQISAASISVSQISSGSGDENVTFVNDIVAPYLEVDAAKVNGELSAATISVDKISGGENSADITFTGTIVAPNLEVDAANVSGELTAATISVNSVLIGDELSIGGYSWIGGTSNTSRIDGSLNVDGNIYCNYMEAYDGLCVEGITFITSNGWSLNNDNLWGMGYDTGGGSIGSLYSESIDFDGDGATLSGSWYTSSSEAIVSDVNKKHSISDIPDAYRTIFTNLKPKVYKYNDGKSDRYHVGFIAQDVEEAILDAGLTTQDFAGFVRAQLRNKETGELEEVCMLRYEEFIALNTLEIQKLNERVAKLEALVESLLNNTK